MIIATAGHIDHGKTSLVRALTGVDTDRLPEEKKRGISIDLGFAYWRAASGPRIGFVDVPGHERFIGNMLAGVCGVDFALVVVAADDGVMPQTREHVAILDLLGIDRGIAVLTKVDRVAADRVNDVRAQVEALLAPTRLAGSRILAASTVTGEGMPALRAALLGGVAAGRGEMRQRMLRYAIDRAFTSAGSGTVVTGTLFAGAVRVGDRVVVSPAGIEVRIRGLQKDGSAAEEAGAGERCALNLAGVEVARAGRGNWLVALDAHRPTRRIDARLNVLGSESRTLRHWTAVRLHTGTATRNARVAVPGGGSIPPSGSGHVQLVLDEPIAATHGERFILRDSAANRTLGGGTMLDPAARPFKRDRTAREARLAALEQPSLRAAFDALLAGSAAGVDLSEFGGIFNLSVASMRALAAECGARVIGRERPVALPGDALDLMEQRIFLAVRAHHARQPQAEGRDIEALRRECAPAMPAEPFMDLLRASAHRHRFVIQGTTARLADHAPKQNPAQRKVWDTLQPLLGAAGCQVPRLRDLAERTGVGEGDLLAVLRARARTGDVVRVSDDRFCLQSTLERLAAVAAAAAAGDRNGEFTVAQYRDRSGVGRSLAIEILECFDRIGITRRVGPARRMRGDYAAILRRSSPAGTADRPDRPP